MHVGGYGMVNEKVEDYETIQNELEIDLLNSTANNK